MKDIVLFLLNRYQLKFLLFGRVDLQEMKTDIRQHLIFSQLNPEE